MTIGNKYDKVWLQIPISIISTEEWVPRNFIL